MLLNTRLLVVEDDAALGKLMLRQLKEFRCDVQLAETGEEALQMCAEAGSPPDVVIMDIRLPGMDGITCARHIRRDYDETVIIFLTGAIEEPVLQLARDVTPAAFILKDLGNFQAESLRATVRLALDQRERNRRASHVEASNIRNKRLMLFDELTRVYNRAGFNTLAPRFLDPGRQVVIFIDLDNLKTINDVHGHKVGDDALRRFADILQETFREDDLIARLSGDEFAVLAAIAEGTLASVKHRIHQALALANLNSSHPYRLEASIGVVLAEAGQDIADLLAKADAAMYEEKRLHKNRAAKKLPSKD